ncbi:unnamed protein product [Euphydryas editha]|uniref:MMS19 nucleotide excision repair protein n=1 Tax=Euphydryas editha TaxID=104508 RepID=A0AAU9UGL2_EUPED|nr:unnamed protein product [Euphydryas editha]
MNFQSIEYLSRLSSEISPETQYLNPLLDKNEATLLSKTCIKLLNYSEENKNVKVREGILEGIRKICKIEPDDHVKVDENLTEFLITYYEKLFEGTKSSHINGIDKKLDAFLIRKSKEISIKPSFQQTMNPAVVQALTNLNVKVEYQEALVQDIIHWNQDDKICMKFIKDQWNSVKTRNLSESNKCTNFINVCSLKIKTEIEKLLLDITYELLHNDNVEPELILKKKCDTLLANCSVSPECFQICISILNTLFLMNNFHYKIDKFIVIFVETVKFQCSVKVFASLYPTHLTHIVTLLDITLSILPTSLRLNYIQISTNYLKKLQKQSETDLILLLSHFPHWHSYYFKE